MKKHILVIADGRSAITTRWIDMLQSLEFRVSLISTYPLTKKPTVDHVFILPVAFSAVGENKQVSEFPNQKPKSRNNWKRTLIQQARPVVMRMRYFLGPSTLDKYQQQLLNIIAEIKPDLVHALRIPFEGMLAQATPDDIALLVSVWGNDFTLHANANQKMNRLTKSVLQRADGVIADVERDINLAYQLGFSDNKPSLVVPGGGGIHFEEINSSKLEINPKTTFPENTPVIINPRGIRAYAKTDVFFQSIPIVLRTLPEAIFICPAMENKPEAIQWVERLKIHDNVRLLPVLTQNTLWSYFHNSHISISITTHDGTPNTLLETMACGCFPIAGDIESIREWITPGVNGFLVSPHDPNELAENIINAYENQKLRKEAKVINDSIIKSRADANKVRDLVYEYYQKFLY